MQSNRLAVFEEARLRAHLQGEECSQPVVVVEFSHLLGKDVVAQDGNVVVIHRPVERQREET